VSRSVENKIVLVTRKTRLDELVARFNTLEQARFYVVHSGQDFSDYLAEHERYRESVAAAVAALEPVGRLQLLDRSFLPSFLFGPEDAIVALGQDGLVANTLKYLSGQSLVGVNPDPQRWDGVLLPFVVEDLGKIMPQVFAGRRPIKEVTMAEARLNDGQRMRAVNDLFIGPKSHTSAHYTIRSGDQEERHSSSGLIVSTGFGSTGWLKSLIAGATALTSALTGRELKIKRKRELAWDAEELRFTVREPFPSRTTEATLIYGVVTRAIPLVVRSLMPEGGVIFSDGIEKDFLAFNSGAEATITLAETKGRLVG
jgi:NAD kinase